MWLEKCKKWKLTGWKNADLSLIRGGKMQFISSNTNQRDKYALSKNNKRHSDLAQLMANDAFHYSEGIVLCNGNVEVEDKTVYLPIYRVEFIQNTKNEGWKLVHPDISSLI